MSVYTLSLLVTFLRVQLNILGGYLYARAREFEDEGECTSTETEAEYLRQAHRLKTHGECLNRSWSLLRWLNRKISGWAVVRTLREKALIRKQKIDR